MSTPDGTQTAVSGNVGTWQMSTPDGTETAVYGDSGMWHNVHPRCHRRPFVAMWERGKCPPPMAQKRPFVMKGDRV